MFDSENIKDGKHNLDRLSMLDEVLKVKEDQAIFLIDRLKVDNSTIDINRLSEIVEFFNNLETTIEDFDLTTENKTVIKELFEESKSEARDLTTKFREIISEEFTKSEKIELRETLKRNNFLDDKSNKEFRDGTR
jgi:hypothetical protein